MSELINTYRETYEYQLDLMELKNQIMEDVLDTYYSINSINVCEPYDKEIELNDYQINISESGSIKKIEKIG